MTGLRKHEKNNKKNLLRYVVLFVIGAIIFFTSLNVFSSSVSALENSNADIDISAVQQQLLQNGSNPTVNIELGSGEAEGSSSAIDLLLLLALIALLPSFLMMMTCFTRIIISLSFLRTAMGTQSAPPNQVLIGISIFLTLFIMMPVLEEIKTSAYEPYKNNEITQEEFIDEGIKPLKVFMLKQVYDNDLELFVSLADEKGTIDASYYDSQEKLPELSLLIIVPAFITSELKRAFLIGFLIYIPFLVIDLVVSSVLMAMGMVMLPPAMISAPFKLMLFVLIDGWNLMIESLIVSFN